MATNRRSFIATAALGGVIGSLPFTSKADIDPDYIKKHIVVTL
jgi:hypothetical protein